MTQPSKTNAQSTKKRKKKKTHDKTKKEIKKHDKQANTHERGKGWKCVQERNREEEKQNYAERGRKQCRKVGRPRETGPKKKGEREGATGGKVKNGKREETASRM